MKAHFARGRQGGVAAVEFALILIFTFFLLPAVFLFARVFYHYNVIKQATQDAANAMAATPRIELMTFAGMSAAKARSEQMVINAIVASGIYPPDTMTILVLCNGGACGPSASITAIHVYASFTLFDAFWRDTIQWLPDEIGPAWTFAATSDASYQN